MHIFGTVKTRGFKWKRNCISLIRNIYLTVFFSQESTSSLNTDFDCVHTRCGHGQDGNIVAVCGYSNVYQTLAQSHTHLHIVYVKIIIYYVDALYLHVKTRFVFCIVSIILVCTRTDVLFIYSIPGGRAPAAHYTVYCHKLYYRTAIVGVHETFEKLHSAPGARTVHRDVT